MTDRGLLQQARDALNKLVGGHVKLSDFIRAENVVTEIDQRLLQPEWVRVEDALPVVPKGDDFAHVWVVVNGAVQQDAYALQPEHTPEGYCTLSAEPDFCARGVTHWRYAEPTPNPPEMTK